jgi:hypothetical protein
MMGINVTENGYPRNADTEVVDIPGWAYIGLTSNSTFDVDAALKSESPFFLVVFGLTWTPQRYEPPEVQRRSYCRSYRRRVCDHPSLHNIALAISDACTVRAILRLAPQTLSGSSSCIWSSSPDCQSAD